MKKVIVLFIALICCMRMDAQVMKIYKSGAVVKTYVRSEIDSIVYEEHEYVDLGLPSGTLWATCNVGASKPEEYGEYFAWGETTGFRSDTSDGRSFDWNSYKWCNGASTTLTKYCTDSHKGTVDNKTTLEVTDDAATYIWGKEWTMPTYSQMQELIDNTTNTWVEINGKKGIKFSSKSNSNKYIFLPATPYRAGTGIYEEGIAGRYWSKELFNDPRYAYRLYISYGFIQANAGSDRQYGHSIRPVRSSNK